MRQHARIASLQACLEDEQASRDRLRGHIFVASRRAGRESGGAHDDRNNAFRLRQQAEAQSATGQQHESIHTVQLCGSARLAPHGLDDRGHTGQQQEQRASLTTRANEHR